MRSATKEVHSLKISKSLNPLQIFFFKNRVESNFCKSLANIFLQPRRYTIA
jgi:hypothetical protein